MPHRPWSELTKHWSPERRTENERAKVKLRAHIGSLQSGAPADDAAGAAPPPRTASRRPAASAPSIRSGLDHVRD